MTVSEPSCCLTLIEKIVGHSHSSRGHPRLPKAPRRTLHYLVRPPDGRVDVEPHRGPPAAHGPDRFGTNPAQLVEDLERVVDAPRLRQSRPGVAVHVAGGERSRQPAAVSLRPKSAAATRAGSVTLA